MSKLKCCFICAITFQPERLGQKCCSIDCAIKHSKNVSEKEEKISWNERKKVLAEKVKSLSDYMKDLQKEVNTIARLIDRGHPCISSGRYTGQMQGGHYFSVGSCNTLRFNLFNIYGQSVADNQFKHGNLEQYRLKLIETFGENHLLYVESLKVQYPKIKFDKDDLIQSTKIARTIIRELKTREYPFTNRERLEKRAEYNSQINIYTLTDLR